MERALIWTAFVIGWLGWLAGYFASRPRRTHSVDHPLPKQALPHQDWSNRFSISRGFLASAVSLPFLIFLLTWPSQPPFASGQGLGGGFLIGGIAAMLGAIVVLRVSDNRNQSTVPTDATLDACALYAPFFIAVAAVAATLLSLSRVLTDALPCMAIGWFAVSFLVTMGQKTHNNDGTDRQTQPCKMISDRVVKLLSGTGFTITLAMLCLLGKYRGDIQFASALKPVAWNAVCIVFAASGCLLSLCCVLPAMFFARLPLAQVLTRVSAPLFRGRNISGAVAPLLRVILGSALLLGISWLFQTKLAHHPPLRWIAVLGIFATLSAWWILARDAAQDRRPGIADSLQNSGIAMVVVLCSCMAAYQLMAGVGLGMMLIVCWLVSAPGFSFAPIIDPAPVAPATSASADYNVSESSFISSAVIVRLLTLLAFGVILSLYRAFVVRFDMDVRGVSITDFYALFGVLVGVVTPIMLSGYVLNSGASPKLLRVFVSGAAVLFVPVVMLSLFGPRCVLALLIGLAVSTVLSTSALSGVERDENQVYGGSTLLTLLPVLFAIAIGLAMTQWTHYILPIALLSRAAKIHLLEITIGSIAVLLLVNDVSERIVAARRLKIGATLTEKGAL